MAAKTWQICVMVTEPTDNHTLKVEGQSKVDFTNCMVQVNTLNWDAVEARDTAYIHSTNGENCFVGDIHYGDVLPPKNPTCTFFTDPFASYNVPANTCTYTKMKVEVLTTLTPGTYCEGLEIKKDVTFSPGIYYLQGGDFKISDSANVIANNVTFLLSDDAKLDISSTGTLTLSPNTNAGQWSGFVFYFDRPASKTGTVGTSTIEKAKVNMSGVIYLVGHKLEIKNSAHITINPGSIIADYILPSGQSSLDLTGSLNSSLAALNLMKKSSGTSGRPILVR